MKLTRSQWHWSHLLSARVWLDWESFYQNLSDIPIWVFGEDLTFVRCFTTSGFHKIIIFGDMWWGQIIPAFVLLALWVPMTCLGGFLNSRHIKPERNVVCLSPSFICFQQNVIRSSSHSFSPFSGNRWSSQEGPCQNSSNTTLWFSPEEMWRLLVVSKSLASTKCFDCAALAQGNACGLISWIC